ncbi:hypothetical protein [Streptomyces sp. RG80]|uniref:hypothetical protein n=1 Tax=Streptomyces sp. RG80 TaxID=3157340 RepID=UPI00338DC7DE
MRLLFVPGPDGDAAGAGVGGDDGDGFEATCEILVRLTSEYDERRRGSEAGSLDEFTVEQALEYRHRGTADGRLALWREEHVRALLLEWLPRNVTVLPEEIEEHDAPGAVATLVEFLAASGLLDVRSDDPARLRGVAESLRQAHAEAMEDPRFMRSAKFWMLTAARSGVDVRDERALDRFIADVRAGRVEYDEAALAKVMGNQFLGGFLGAGPDGHSLLEERTLPLPVVDLGDEEALREAAASVDILGQLAEVARWLGKDGRPLTKTGRLKTADALELACHLGIDRGLGAVAGPLKHLAGDGFDHIRRADQLPYLRLLVEWAREARLVRAYRGRLVAVAGARTVREDPLALAARALTALPALRDPLLIGPVWDVPSRLYPRFDLLLTDLLAALYGMPAGTPWPMLWHTVRAGHLDDDRWPGEGEDTYSPAELRVVLDLLVRTGVIAFERGPVDASVLDGLRSLAAEDGSTGPAAHLRALLRSCEGDDVELLRLTPLGTYAVRELLTLLGRFAPALGDLRTADATTLLAALFDEYDDQHTRTELAGWIEAAGGWDTARPVLADALKRVRLHARRNGLLRMLVAELPDGYGPDLLRHLRTDPELAPSALFVGQEQAAEATLRADKATEHGPDGMEDMDDREYALAATESLLLMRELDGETGLLDAVGHTRADAETLTTMLRVAQTSGHPDISGLERLAAVDVAALRARSSHLGRLRADAARKRKSGSARKKGNRRKRR